jgi:hypothetical protein
LERHDRDGLSPAGRGVIVDPPDGKLPAQPWARAEEASRFAPERGYDDPTAHCFAAGVPRSMYVPQPYQIIQTSDYIVFLFERMSWRIVPLDGRSHLADHLRLWQGDSVGHWEGDTLVVDVANQNDKTWFDMSGNFHSDAIHVVERYTPVDADNIKYEATIDDPKVYTQPWKITFGLRRNRQAGFELMEFACVEGEKDLQHYVESEGGAAKKQ